MEFGLKLGPQDWEALEHLRGKHPLMLGAARHVQVSKVVAVEPKFSQSPFPSREGLFLWRRFREGHAGTPRSSGPCPVLVGQHHPPRFGWAGGHPRLRRAKRALRGCGRTSGLRGQPNLPRVADKFRALGPSTSRHERSGKADDAEGDKNSVHGGKCTTQPALHKPHRTQSLGQSVTDAQACTPMPQSRAAGHLALTPLVQMESP